MANITLINNHYPVEYFAGYDLAQQPPHSPNQFWASKQEYAPAIEELIFDFGSERPVNFLDFEIANKPVDIKVFYKIADVWQEVTPNDLFEADLSVNYLASVENPWTYFEFHFDLVQTQFIKIELTRREDKFPFIDSEPIEFSIEIRNLRLMHLIFRADEFIEDSGTDILGNTYRTDIEYFHVEAVDDEDSETFWQSQPNPSRFAVECIYFDLRDGFQAGTMEYLNTNEMQDLDNRSMDDMALYFKESVLIDEIFIDPVTIGPVMHIYISNDDEPEWDNKLWTPIPRHYILRKGFHSLPKPEYVKYVKLEFSQLAAAPYNEPEYPKMPPITYRRYPTWVQNYFNTINIESNKTNHFSNPINTISVDPLQLGFIKEIDRFDKGEETRHLPTVESTDPSVREFIEGLVIQQSTADEIQQDTENKINFNTSFMWQRDLISSLSSDRALSRIAQAGETGFNAELPPISLPPPSSQSVPDLTQAKEEKESPVMWFPIKCRHGYQVLKADRPGKIAYFVAIRTVSFHRRDYTIEYDESVYTGNFGDIEHSDSNDFVQDGWVFRVE